MTLTKNKMVQVIGQRTRLKNRDIQMMLETLIEVWKEEFINGGRIELENVFVLEVKQIDRGSNSGTLLIEGQIIKAPQQIRIISIRLSRKLRKLL